MWPKLRRDLQITRKKATEFTRGTVGPVSHVRKCLRESGMLSFCVITVQSVARDHENALKTKIALPS